LPAAPADADKTVGEVDASTAVGARLTGAVVHIYNDEMRSVLVNMKMNFSVKWPKKVT